MVGDLDLNTITNDEIGNRSINGSPSPQDVISITDRDVIRTINLFVLFNHIDFIEHWIRLK